MTEIWMIYSMFPTREKALSAAHTLVNERLVACANVHGDAVSIYRWEGAVQEESEVTLVAKTQKDKVAAAIARIKALHTYELSCIVAWKLADGLPGFLKWVAQETA